MTVSEAMHTDQPSPVHLFHVLLSDTHTHTRTHTFKESPTHHQPPPAPISSGPGLAYGYSPQSSTKKKKGNHKATAAATDTLLLSDSRFSLPPLFLQPPPSETRWGFEDDNYQKGGVQLFNRETSGSEVSKGCAAAPTSKLSLLPLSLQLPLIGEEKNSSLWPSGECHFTYDVQK